MLHPNFYKHYRYDGEKKIYLDGSPSTHNQKYNSQYATDFLVAIGTPIQAIADWKVIDIKECFDGYGIQEIYGDRGNYITIAHAEDKISQYIHIEKLSPTKYSIWLGSYVKKWQIIGYTWASWRMDLPHLHFAFYENAWGQYKNIPMFSPDSGMRIEEIDIE